LPVNEMMNRCTTWMMSLGTLGMVLGAVLLVAVIVLMVAWIVRIGRRFPR
jgi:hypothetical protein